MALSLVFLFGCMVSYAAKFFLLVCLWQEPHLRVYFTALATAHIAVNMHGTYAHCQHTSQPPRGASMIAVMLIFGVVTPFMHLVHILDMAAAWWTSQDLGRRPSLRPAPLDTVLEGLVFVCASLHLRICIVLGRLKAPDNMSWLPWTFEALLSFTLVTSLVSTATGIVMWDSALSIKLSRDMYGWPGRGCSGARGGGIFIASLVLRCSEVAGRSVLLAVLAAVLDPQHTVGYVMLIYTANVLVLLLTSHSVATTWPLTEAAMLAWPLLFADLTQFVDCPKHFAAAKSATGFMCGLRALEMAIACSVTVAAILLEAQIKEKTPGLASLYGLVGTEAEGVQPIQALRSLYRGRAITGWGVCLLAHYLYMVIRWCDIQGPRGLFSLTLRDLAAGGLGRLPSVSVGRRGGHPPAWPDTPDQGATKDKEFWPPAPSLAPLLLTAACDRAPVACGLVSMTSLSSLFSAFTAEPRLRMDDFEIIRLIGCGEFGKVFQVRQRSTRQFFAMKRLSKEFYAQKRMMDKAVREISTLSLARDHPFVVKLIYTIENSCEWAMVMEYCPCGDLQQLLLSQGFPGLALDRTLWISAEVALALEYLHTNGIVFRDLKLENVVIDGDGHAKLTDFGLAKQHQDGQNAILEAELAGSVYKSFTRTFCGSYGYAAPEVNPRRQVHGFAADLYSFGVLIFMMLMGGEVYHDKREAPFERRLPPETPGELREVIDNISFDFYWTCHHFLEPARAAHRVEVNLDGAIVIVPRGQRGVRRQARPRSPPNSPQAQEAEGEQTVTMNHPTHFPMLACTNSQATRRRWDSALDLIRALTHEFPEQRGTMATVKRHAFFTEEIEDWRTVHPRSWLVDQLKDRLLAPPSLVAGVGVPSLRLSHWLDHLPAKELLFLQDDPDTSLELLEQKCSETPLVNPSPAEEGRQGEHEEPRLAGQYDGAASSRAAQASTSSSPRHSWILHYP